MAHTNNNISRLRRFGQRWFSIRKSITISHHIYINKDKKHVILTIDHEITLEKIQQPFLIWKINNKNIRYLCTDGCYSKINKRCSPQPTCQPHANRETPKTFSLKLGIIQGCPMVPWLYPLLPLVFNIILQVLPNMIRQHKEITGLNWKDWC